MKRFGILALGMVLTLGCDSGAKKADGAAAATTEKAAAAATTEKAAAPAAEAPSELRLWMKSQDLLNWSLCLPMWSTTEPNP